MIQIQERPSKKSVGRTSLFVSFDYNPKYIEIAKLAENYNYNPKTHEWEFPCSKLSYLIDNYTLLDDIELSLLPDDNSIKVEQTIEHKYAPFDYQSDGIDWLINRNYGLLLDMPGLGKTLQIIYAAEELKKQKGIEHCLIVCGINTLKQNWRKEIEKFSTESCRVIGERINKKGKVTYASVNDRAEELYQPIDEFFVIINKEMFSNSLVVDAILNSKNKFDMIVADELHKMKDPNSQSGKGFLKLTKIGDYHFGLTGTPLINSPLDAFTALKFIGQEKSTYSNFKNFYCVMGNRFSEYSVTGYKNLDILRQEIEDCSIRREKSILNLPPKFIIPEYIEMDTSQQKFYDDLQAGIVTEADRVDIKNTTLLGMVTRLRQAATCPSVLTSSSVSNAKFDRCIELTEELVKNNDKVVIFSTFKSPLYDLEKVFKDYHPLVCTGDQSDAEISDMIDMFQEDDEHMIMLATAQKMGTGITLTRSCSAIFLDSNWTDALETQTEDRLHRIGANKAVTIFKLIVKGTIDERIQTILERKRAMSDYIIDNKLTNETEELKELLGLNGFVGYR